MIFVRYQLNGTTHWIKKLSITAVTLTFVVIFSQNWRYTVCNYIYEITKYIKTSLISGSEFRYKIQQKCGGG